MSVIDDYFFWEDVPNVDTSMFMQVSEAKKKIGSIFTNRALLVHPGIQEKELANLYSMWKMTSEGSLAQKISNELDKQIKEKLSQKITGADFNVEKALSNLTPESPYLEMPETSAKEYGALIDELNRRINAMLDILGDSTGALQKAALQACIGSKITDPELAAKYDGKILSLGLNSSTANTFQTLQNLYNDLNTLIKDPSTSQDSLLASYKDGQTISPDLLAKKIASTLSSIAGEAIFEPIVISIINKILKNEKEINKEALAAFVSEAGQKIIDGNFLQINVNTPNFARQSKDIAQKGSQGKPDLYVTWNNGQVTITFGGSIKLRQSNHDFSSSGKYNGSIKYSTSIKEILEYGGSNIIESFQAALAAVVNTRSSYRGGGYAVGKAKERNGAWDAMKNSILFEIMLDKFVGDATTNQFGEANFADFIVVNQYIMPFWSVIENIANSEPQFGDYLTATGAGMNWTFDNSHFAYWRKNNRKRYYARIDNKTNTKDVEGKALQESLYNEMWNTIISKKIQLNLFIGKMLTI